jgi:hypothetical protein
MKWTQFAEKQVLDAFWYCDRIDSSLGEIMKDTNLSRHHAQKSIVVLLQKKQIKITRVLGKTVMYKPIHQAKAGPGGNPWCPICEYEKEKCICSDIKLEGGNTNEETNEKK